MSEDFTDLDYPEGAKFNPTLKNKFEREVKKAAKEAGMYIDYVGVDDDEFLGATAEWYPEEHLEDSRKNETKFKKRRLKDKNIRNRPLRKVKDGDPGDDFKVEKGDIVRLTGGPIREIIVLGFSGDGEIGSEVLVHDTSLEASPEAIQDLINEPQGLTLSRMNDLMFGEGDDSWWDEMHEDSPANSVALDVFEITGAYRCKDVSTGKSYSMYVKVD